MPTHHFPAQATAIGFLGLRPCLDVGEVGGLAPTLRLAVIPAKAGIRFQRQNMDSRFRGGDRSSRAPAPKHRENRRVRYSAPLSPVPFRQICNSLQALHGPLFRLQLHYV